MTDTTKLDRRGLLKATGTAGLVGLSGCIGGIGGTGGGGFPESGRDVSLYIPYSQGGGFDLVIRGVAPYVEEGFQEITDTDVNATPQNVTGGGGTRNYNEHYHREPDGYHMSGIHGTVAPLNQILSIGDIQYDFREFEFIGMQEKNIKVIMTRSEEDQMGWEDIKSYAESAGSFVVGTGGVGGPDHIAFSILSEETGIDADFVHYEGAAPSIEAVIRGEADFACQNFSTGFSWWQDGDITYHILFDSSQPPLEGPDVLFAPDEGVPRWELLADLINTIKFAVLPPDTPEDIVSTWAEVFEYAVTHDEYLADMKEQQRPIVHAGAEEATETAMGVYESQEGVQSMLEDMIDA